MVDTVKGFYAGFFGTDLEEGEEAPAMTAASDSECEASTSARQIGSVAGGVRGQTNEGAPGDGAPTSGR